MTAPLPPPRWDVFCRVIDNHGDLGVCWRLARALAERGHTVRCWIDDPSALAWMAPGPLPAHITVLPWALAERMQLPDGTPVVPHPAVIEAFGCELPLAFQAAMAAQPERWHAAHPHWVNLEYLTAEAWAKRSHRLPSPVMSGPAQGLTKHFFFPGFTPDSGGLLHLGRLANGPAAVPAPLPTKPPGDWWIAVFCYEQAALSAWVNAWRRCWAQAEPAIAPLRLHWLVLPGLPQAQWRAAELGLPNQHADADEGAPQRETITFLPYLPQPTFDALLQQCDVNLVRGEDSWAGAVLSGRPLLWQAYPQQDGASLDKLEAFLDLYLADATPELRQWLTLWHRAWNALDVGQGAMTDRPASPPVQWPMVQAWQAHAARWRTQQAATPNLLDELLAFMGFFS